MVLDAALLLLCAASALTGRSTHVGGSGDFNGPSGASTHGTGLHV